MLISAGTASSRGTEDSETIITMVQEMPEVLPRDPWVSIQNHGRKPKRHWENHEKTFQKHRKTMKNDQKPWKKPWKSHGKAIKRCRAATIAHRAGRVHQGAIGAGPSEVRALAGADAETCRQRIYMYYQPLRATTTTTTTTTTPTTTTSSIPTLLTISHDS